MALLLRTQVTLENFWLLIWISFEVKIRFLFQDRLAGSCFKIWSLLFSAIIITTALFVKKFLK